MNIDLAEKTVLVTGAGRGLGLALVTEFVSRETRRVLAGVRNPLTWALGKLRDLDVEPVELDLTSLGHVPDDVDVLVNNAGVAVHGPVTDDVAVRRNLAVNFHGTLAVTYHVQPRDAVVNVMTSWIRENPGGPMGAYVLSKAALHSASQALRAGGLHVLGAYPGAIDTDMTRGFDIPKVDPAVVAKSIVDALVRGDEEVYP